MEAGAVDLMHPPRCCPHHQRPTHTSPPPTSPPPPAPSTSPPPPPNSSGPHLLVHHQQVLPVGKGRDDRRHGGDVVAVNDCLLRAQEFLRRRGKAGEGCVWLGLCSPAPGPSHGPGTGSRVTRRPRLG
jgi:hypothetical protein